jgi:hypothetical protein
MATISANDVVNHYMWTTDNVEGYDFTFKNVTQNFAPRSLLGLVYSWVINPSDKQVYWMFYPTQQDYNNFTNAFYVKQDPNALTLPDLPDILQHIQDMQDVQAKLKELDAIDSAGGLIPYYIEKYGKIALIAAGVIYVGIPLVKSISNKNTTGSIKKSSGLLLLLLASGVLIAATKKKKPKGSVIVEPLAPGNFVQDNGQTYIEPITVIPTTPVLLPSAPQILPNTQPINF